MSAGYFVRHSHVGLLQKTDIEPCGRKSAKCQKRTCARFIAKIVALCASRLQLFNVFLASNFSPRAV